MKYKNKLFTLALILNIIFVAFLIGEKIYLIYFPPTSLESILTSPYYLVKSELYKKLPKEKGEVVFIGDSQTDFFELGEFFGNPKIKNRAISGEITKGQLLRLGEITKGHPSKIFLEIGINDILHDVPEDSICMNYEKIISYIKERSPESVIYIQSVLPTGLNTINGNNALQIISSVNKKAEKICLKRNVTFIDLYSKYIIKEQFNPTYFCFDKLHLNVEGYFLWKKIIERYI